MFLDAFPIAVELRSGLLLPFEYGCFEVEVESRPVKVYLQRHAESEAISVIKTSVELGGGERFWVGGEDQQTRKVTLKEIATVYETSIEAVNSLITASKIAYRYLTYLPLYDEDYVAAMNFKHVEFFYCVPQANQQIISKVCGFCFGGKQLQFVSTDEFNESVRGIVQQRNQDSRTFVVDEMLIAANKAYFDGEYEVMLILFEAVFEALLKRVLRSYYESLPDSSFKETEPREQQVDKRLHGRIRDLVDKEYPKIPDPESFCKDIPEYDNWMKHYNVRNDIIHHMQMLGRLDKKEAIQIRDDFQQIFRKLFGIERIHGEPPGDIASQIR
jgi:hypothetical protein